MRTARGAGEPRRSHAAFSLAELSVLLAVIGTLCALSLPAFLGYYRTARVRAAAADIAAHLNQARQHAIQSNQVVCVHITPTALHYHSGTCANGAVWLGPGTDASGNIPVPDNITLAATANPVFSHLGAAAPATTVVVTDGIQRLSVVLSASGRVTIGP